MGVGRLCKGVNERLTVVCSIDRSKGASRTHPLVQFLSFACSSRDNFDQIIGLHPHLGVSAPVWESLDPPLDSLGFHPLPPHHQMYGSLIIILDPIQAQFLPNHQFAFFAFKWYIRFHGDTIPADVILECVHNTFNCTWLQFK